MTRPRIWLVDDEPMALRSLEALLALDSRVALVGSTTDPRRALAAMRRGEADILIVDIQMPGMTGIELVQSVPADQLPRVIFATAHGEYALDAFDA
ncbi:MAG: response regulator, partial [Planctomycetota bacterium]